MLRKPRSAQLFDPVILNNRIAQNVARNRVQIFARIERDLEKLTLPNVLNAFMSQAIQCGTNGLALRVEDGLFEGYVDACFHCNHVNARYRASSKRPICRFGRSFFRRFFSGGGANVRIRASIFRWIS
jgi:hypothetical protein